MGEIAHGEAPTNGVLPAPAAERPHVAPDDAAPDEPMAPRSLTAAEPDPVHREPPPDHPGGPANTPEPIRVAPPRLDADHPRAAADGEPIARPNGAPHQAASDGRRPPETAERHQPAPGLRPVPGAAIGPGACTAPQLRRFIKSRPYVPMHELRRRFGIDGGEDDVTPVDLSGGRIYVGLPPREGSLLGELLRGGEIGYELSLDPRSPIVIGLYPMRPVARS